MKISSQVYVRHSFAAVKTYCEAFGAEITLEILAEDGNGYAHCELSVGGSLFLAVSEASAPGAPVPVREDWQVMTFNVYEMGSEEAVRNAFRILSLDGTVVYPPQAVPWNPCCATVIDRFGVCWWIAV